MKKNILILLLQCAVKLSAQNTYVVTSTNDPSNPFSTVTGELRWAIEQANAHPGSDNITFNIPGAAPAVIYLQTQLPSVTDAVNIDGESQPANGYTGNGKKVVISGNAFYSVIDINGANASNSTLKGVEVKGKNSYEVTITNANNVSIINNVIYSNDAPNSYTWFLYFFHSNNNIIQGNILGTDQSLTTSSNFNGPGVRLAYSSNNLIGGSSPGNPNLFYNMRYPAQWVPMDVQLGNGNKISQNLFVNNTRNIDIYTNAGCLPMSSHAANVCKLPPVITSANKAGSITTVIGTANPNDVVEIFKSNAGGIDAVQFLGNATADINGDFSVTFGGLTIGDKVNATATDLLNNTSEFSLVTTVEGSPICTDISIYSGREAFCTNTAGPLSVECSNPAATFDWSFGDGSFGTGPNPSHMYANAGTYLVSVTMHQPGQADITVTRNITVTACTKVECKDCIGSFQPEPGNYILSAWVREDVSTLPKTYSNAKIEVSYTGVASSPVQYGTNGTKNKIIEGWQKIEEVITIPVAATSITMKLINLLPSNDVYFDDIRIFPVDGQMKTFVYDPVTLRLSAMLDENNYATFYEYDEEGKLIRVKKETEKGIMTIQESREATKKK